MGAITGGTNPLFTELDNIDSEPWGEMHMEEKERKDSERTTAKHQFWIEKYQIYISTEWLEEDVKEQNENNYVRHKVPEEEHVLVRGSTELNDMSALCLEWALKTG